MAERVVAKRRITEVRDGHARQTVDALAAEEPMELRVNGEAVSVTMRTPGDDFDLALGFCLTEGLVDSPKAVAGIRYCAGVDDDGRNTFNIVDVATRDGLRPRPELRRHVYTASSCGICGTSSLEAVRKRVDGVHDDPVRVTSEVLSSLPEKLREAQRVFERTGGLHAAGVFTAEGELVCAREDVGRHNAVDKVIGWAVGAGALPLNGHVLLVSGRIAFEIAQKALIAHIPVLAAVSAPSSLAVALAADAGMTTVGFLRGPDMNIYTTPERITPSR